MSDAAPLITTAFGIWGDQLDPTECTRITGLEPTEVEIKGQPRPGGRPPVPVTNWGITLEKRRSFSIDQPLVELLDLLWPRRSNLLEFLSTHDVSSIFFSTITIYEERPEYCLSPDTLRRLSYFKTQYCLDIFNYSE